MSWNKDRPVFCTKCGAEIEKQAARRNGGAGHTIAGPVCGCKNQQNKMLAIFKTIKNAFKSRPKIN